MGKRTTWRTTSRIWDHKAREFRTVPVELSIDWQAIADTLARKAYANRSSRSALVAGAIVATVKRKG